MVNVKWSIEEDIVDTVEALILGTKGAYSSLIGTLVIILHKHKAELQLINAAHVRLNAYSQLPVIVCRSLYQDSENGDEFSSPTRCAPAIVVMSHIENKNGPWSPFPQNAQAQLRQNGDGVRRYEIRGEHRHFGRGAMGRSQRHNSNSDA